MKDLSVIVISYNTKKITTSCIESLYNSSPNVDFEIILVDNASTDGSPASFLKIKKKHPNFILLENKENIGFTKANNQALQIASGRCILFLNSDVIINQIDFAKLLNYLDTNTDIGALTIKVILPTGRIDPASHRGFPTIWNSFCYFFKLERLFSSAPILNKIFGGYHLVNRDLNTTHEIDSPSGAFYLTRKNVLERVGVFDEDYFMYGEDLDLSYRIKKGGFKIVYYPFFKVTHLKYASGLGVKDIDFQQKIKDYFYQAMKIFYKKHYESHHFPLINKFVYLFIDLRKKFL